MEVDPPSALTRFGIFFLIGGITLILILWGVLKYFDKPGAVSFAKPEPTLLVTPTVPPLLARPSPSGSPP